MIIEKKFSRAVINNQSGEAVENMEVVPYPTISGTVILSIRGRNGGIQGQIVVNKADLKKLGENL